MAENRPQKFRKSIFEVKKSNFLFDSINVSGMYCNLSNTFKRLIFRFLKLWHIAKATFADNTKLKNGWKPFVGCAWQVAIHSRNIYWVKKKIWFFDLKNGFSKFLKPFLTHFDIQTWENDTVRLLWRSQKNFETFNQKSSRYVCSKCSGD